MRKKKRETHAKIAIVLLLVLIMIVLIISLILISNMDTNKIKTNPAATTNKQVNKIEEAVKADDYNKNAKKFEEFEEKYQEKTILPRNISVLYAYKGQNSREDLYESLKKYVDLLEKIQKDNAKQNAEKYFEKNIGQIYKNSGVGTIEDFKAMLEKIENKNLDSKEFKYAELEKDSMKLEDLLLW